MVLSVFRDQKISEILLCRASNDRFEETENDDVINTKINKKGQF
jgi:hypothetical protein